MLGAHLQDPLHRLGHGLALVLREPAESRDRGGAIEGNHIDMFVDNAAGKPFPDIVRSNSRYTFEAFIVPKEDPAALALAAAHAEVCKDSDGPGRKRQTGPKPKPASNSSI